MSLETRYEEQGLGWGSSLPVPSVQEIVRKDPLCVPDRYRRGCLEKPTAEALATSLDVPVIDLSLLSSGHEGERRYLDSACKDWGFFQIVNHGISEEVIRQMRAAASGFFDLPIEEKRRYAMAANDIHGYGQLFVVSEEQKLDWADVLHLITRPSKLKNLKYWPTVVSSFKDALEAYSKELERVTKMLLENLSRLMNMEEDGLLRLHGDLTQSTRIAYYPPCSRADEVLGLGSHSDKGSITFLLQDDDVTGLQIRHGGMWIPVKPMPNAFVVNIGDSVEVWSNGLYKSVQHRVITNREKARKSIAMFILPHNDAEVGPLEQMVDEPHRPRRYRTVRFLDVLKNLNQRELEGNYVDALTLQD
ncbi:unnamed protein product [Spirodela intermedia]|uniref:Fe2OG dioxygenase domain-containing protein n=1 Tax=Spirodela intermedia TaxID=51605 RepID=A0A7I8K058_SPIIN|nr:unnamed protein product [Spirodela intermedia]